jgi:hypothetical protein
MIADGLVYHALNRGNNREALFLQPADYTAFFQQDEHLLTVLRYLGQRSPGMAGPR